MKFWFALLALTFFLQPYTAWAKDDFTYYSLQGMAFTANAGGQTAIAIRRRANDQEWSLFANEYLQAGNVPLLGASWDRRFELTSPGWPIRPYLQAGAGLSTGGPLIELMWGFTLAYVIRIDIVTHLIASPRRVVHWSYPFWTGITIPL